MEVAAAGLAEAKECDVTINSSSSSNSNSNSNNHNTVITETRQIGDSAIRPMFDGEDLRRLETNS